MEATPQVSSGLAAGQRRCREITRTHGTTYYWGTVFLPSEQRRHVYGIYALCRLADDIVDEPDAPDVTELGIPHDADPARRLTAFEDRFYSAWERGTDPAPVMHAIAVTARELDLPREVYERFFGAMRLDLVRTSWSSWEELRDVYMEGSAAVIGEMMLPVLRPTTPEAKGPARALGLAFQLTNFLRDVGEDLDRGRVYLPADELAAHGVDPWQRRVTPQWRAFLAAQIARNRELYAEAERGLPMLPPMSARCVAAALTMYSGILTRIEEADYDVFSERRRVPASAKALIGARVLVTGHGGTARAAHSLPERLTGESGPMTSPRDAGVSGRPRPEGGEATFAALGDAVPVHSSGALAERIPIRRIPQPDPANIRSTWRQAALPRIEKALRLAQQRDPGGWYVVGASTDLKVGTSLVRTVAGRETALWRADDGRVFAGPGACPHMGASLGGCDVEGTDVLCRWHGLRLPSEWPGDWPTSAAHDDGVLLWVRLDTDGERPLPEPRLTTRPPAATSFATVYAERARCEPADIIANRLDPWHGAWFHPYAFSNLSVDESASTDECIVTDVTFRLNRTWGVPVRAAFTCPDARTIVMTITDGEGTGSVVETHATPVGRDVTGQPITVMTEATIASSSRNGFRVARALAPAIRPLVRRTQARLWVDDLEYAERRYAVRTGQVQLMPSKGVARVE